jgi:hypothetical protein
MGPWFEPGPGSQFPFPNQSVTPIFVQGYMDYVSMGRSETVSYSSKTGLAREIRKSGHSKFQIECLKSAQSCHSAEVENL